jgi:hypothetical protein
MFFLFTISFQQLNLSEKLQRRSFTRNGALKFSQMHVVDMECLDSFFERRRTTSLVISQATAVQSAPT